MIPFLLPLKLLGSKMLPFLTLKNILIVVAVSSLAWLIWSNTSLRSENATLTERIKVANSEIEKSSGLINQCYNEQKELNKKIKEIQDKHNKAIKNAIKNAESICLRKRVEDLDKPKGKVIDKPNSVIELEKSLNEKFNRRNF